jgi:putative methionine-R-sulfoxide reductase with GAF domain
MKRAGGMGDLVSRERMTMLVRDVRADPRQIACSPTVRSKTGVSPLKRERASGCMGSG